MVPEPLLDLHGSSFAELPGFGGWTPLGSGGFSSVYRALRGPSQEEVAVKIARHAGDPRFPREAAAMRRLGPPRAPRLIDAGTTGSGYPFIVMELIPGQPLAAWCAAVPAHKRPLEERLATAIAVARAVAAMHAAGVVHRDLKPANVLLRSGASAAEPRPVLLDFGLARLDEGDAAGGEGELAEITREGMRLGTALYMSPEQHAGQAAGAAADVYSLGVLVFEVLTGTTPFSGDAAHLSLAHGTHRAPRPSHAGDVPAGLDPIVLRCLAKRPEDRFASALDVANALEAARAEGDAPRPVPARVRPPAPAPTGPAGRTRTEVPLLLFRTRLAPDRLNAALRAHNGHIARAIEGGYVVAFPHHPALPAGIRAALRAAERLGAPAQGAVVHVAPLMVREGPRGMTFLGAALEQVDAWAAEAAERGATLTAAAALAMGIESGDASGPPPSSSTMLTPIAAPPPPALRGRDELLALARQDGERAIATRTPAISTITGDAGAGKTRFAAAIAAAAAPSFARVAVLNAAAPEQDDPERIIAALARLAFELEGAPPAPDAVRAACERCLGGAEGGRLWAPVAYALRAVSEDGAALAGFLEVPGALRRAVARAVGLGLRRRAEEAPLAIVVDDLQWADGAALEAIEIAALGEGRAALWVCAVASPSLLVQRPRWADRAGRSTHRELGPLEPSPARALLLDLLRPVECVPEQVLADLLCVTGGLPLHLVELAHALRASGAIRKRRGTDDHYLAADELLGLSTTPLAERLARRAETELRPELLALLRLCSVLGTEVEMEELLAIESLLDDEGDASIVRRVRIDASVGLERLVRRGLLVEETPSRLRFRHPMLRAALEALIPAPLRRRYHHAAYRHFAAGANVDGERTLRRLALHAAASGELAEAAEAYLELAEAAERRSRHVDAEQLYTSALALLRPEAPAGRERALTGRGRIRSLLERYHDALDDLRAAQALAEARGDLATVASLLLDQATMHDLETDVTASAELTERAAPFVERVRAPRLNARLLSARGRSSFRGGRIAETCAALERAAALAEELGDARTRCESLVLLAPALVAAERLDEAAARFDEAISLCEHIADRFHLGVAHLNRIWLWIKLQDHERAVADQRAALAVARELGNATMEAFATANVAELLYYEGNMDEALPPAQRAEELLRRIHGRVPVEAVIIRARIEAARGAAATARELVRGGGSELAATAYARTMTLLVELLAGDPRRDDAATWDAVIGELRACAQTNEWVDALHHAAARALEVGRIGDARRWIALAGTEVAGSAMWRARFQALRARLPLEG